jgi:hypothetical protein
LPIHSLLVHFDGALQSKMATSWNAARAATLYWRYVIELMSFRPIIACLDASAKRTIAMRN